MQRRQSSRIHSARLQVGFFTLDLGLALLVAAIATVIGFFATQRAADADLARLQAEAILTVRAAAHKLVMDNYIAYQRAAPVVTNGITIDDGDNSGQTRNPTVALLKTLNLGVDSVVDEGIYKSLSSATYGITIKRSTQCTVSSADPGCHVTGLVCLNKPVKSVNSPTGDIDDVGLGVMMARMGGVGAASLTGLEAQVTSANGTWWDDNPYGKAGIVCARFGWGTEGDDYLRLNDTRDPGFKGGETVSGTIPLSTYTLQANGDANVTGSINVGDATAHTGSVTINGAAVAGASCAANQAGAMVWGDVGGTQQLLKCLGNVWTVTGVSMSSEGTACLDEGRIAQTSSGIGIVCRAGLYRYISDLVGLVGIYNVNNYYHLDFIPDPVCAGSMHPRIITLGVVSACSVGGASPNCPNNTGAFYASLAVVAGGATLSIFGSDGVTVAGDDTPGSQGRPMATVATLCTTYP